jgi:hypothetical protein
MATPSTPPPTVTATPSGGAPVTVVLQPGVNGYGGVQATWFDASGAGYNGSSELAIGANDQYRALLRFDLAGLPAGATVQAATLAVYYLGKSNANSLELAAHGVLRAWTDSQATWTYRQAGVPWATGGMAAGSDYVAAPADFKALSASGGVWLALDVTSLAQDWTAAPAGNYGVVLKQRVAGGFVSATFCSENAWGACAAGGWQPRLTITYRMASG